MNASVLRAFALFDNVPDDAISGILPNHMEQRLGPGERLVTQGERNSTLYLLVDGEVDIYLDDNDKPLNVVRAGETIGEVSLLDHKPATASAVTRGECRVITIDETHIWQLIRGCHPFAINFIQLMTRRFRGVNTQVVSSIEKQRLFEQRATIDTLTRLHNRRWLDENFDRVLNRCKTDGQPFSFCMIDLDHFKRVNDTHGHPVGDLVLEKTAAVLAKLSRGGDLAVRYGGEEMCVLLPNTTAAQAIAFAERLRSQIAAQDIEYAAGQQLRVTASIGVATLAGGETSAEMIWLADIALYRAKASGRNQVAFNSDAAA